MTFAVSADEQAAPARSEIRKRTRLPAGVRAQQILDAALREFSQHGFAVTRIDDIARRAGLSKGGVYAHFDSKEQIFEALLERAFVPLVPTPFPFDANDPAASPARFVESFIDHSYQRLADADLIAVIRLMIVESPRIPHIVQRWHREAMAPYHQQQGAILQDAVARGLVRKSPITENFSLAYAPLLYLIVMGMVCDEEQMADSTARLRSQHAQMMHALLQTPGSET